MGNKSGSCASCTSSGSINVTNAAIKIKINENEQAMKEQGDSPRSNTTSTPTSTSTSTSTPTSFTSMNNSSNNASSTPPLAEGGPGNHKIVVDQHQCRSNKNSNGDEMQIQTKIQMRMQREEELKLTTTTQVICQDEGQQQGRGRTGSTNRSTSTCTGHQEDQQQKEEEEVVQEVKVKVVRSSPTTIIKNDDSSNNNDVDVQGNVSPSNASFSSSVVAPPPSSVAPVAPVAPTSTTTMSSSSSSSSLSQCSTSTPIVSNSCQQGNSKIKINQCECKNKKETSEQETQNKTHKTPQHEEHEHRHTHEAHEHHEHKPGKHHHHRHKTTHHNKHKNTYGEGYNNKDNEKPLKSILAAACQCIGFDVAEMWLQTGPTTHQLIHCYINDGTHNSGAAAGSPGSPGTVKKNVNLSLSSSIDARTTSKLKEVYDSEDAPYKVHTLSPALCKKARKFNRIIQISYDTESGSKFLQYSLCDVLSAVAVPVKYLGGEDRDHEGDDHFQPNTNLTVIYFNVRRAMTTLQPAADQFLTHISIAAADLGMNFFVNHPKQKKHRHHHHHHHRHHQNDQNDQCQPEEEKNDDSAACNMKNSTSITSSNRSNNSNGSNNSCFSYSSSATSSSSTSDISYDSKQIKNGLDKEEQRGCIRVRRAAVGLQQSQSVELGGTDDDDNDDDDGDSIDNNDDCDGSNNDDDGDDDAMAQAIKARWTRRSKSMGFLGDYEDF